jgi:putative DNA primase/helicase
MATSATVVSPSIPQSREWHILDAAGKHVATHLRIDQADGSKQMPFELPNGSPGLNGTSSKALLYRAETIADAQGDIYVTEGERAADRLVKLKYNAVATVCGAQSTPDDSVLELFRNRRVVLWADNDQVGREHMRAIGDKLARDSETRYPGIATSVEVVKLPFELPSGFDAADGTDEFILDILGSNHPDYRSWARTAPKAEKKSKALKASYKLVTRELLDKFDPSAMPSDEGLRFLCPLDACADKPADNGHRSLCVNEAKGVWLCQRCGAKGRFRVAGQSLVNDMANAARFVEQHGHEARYRYDRKNWYAFDGTRWKLGGMERVDNWAKDTAASIYLEASEAARTQHPDALKLLKRAVASGNSYSLNGMIATARSLIVQEPTEFDNEPWLLNTESGTLDLRSGELRAHDPGDYITQITACDYDVEATCPLWLAFLDRIFDHDNEMIEYIQRLFGYILTGVVNEDILPILFGDGRNGKSKLTGALLGMMGDYAVKLPITVLIKTKGDQHPAGKAMLFRKRFALAGEPEERHSLKEGEVKDLTGGDTLEARFMHENFFTFEPTHKIVLQTNHKPEIDDTSDGIWERVKLIPFDVTIPAAERDLELGDKLKLEYIGILAWAVRGCMEWQSGGLRQPDKVTLRTADYRGESDELQSFIDEKCVIKTGAKCARNVLYMAYQQWAGNNAMPPRAFVARMKRRNQFGETKDVARMWVGIQLGNQAVLDGGGYGG